jgi:tRNA threonylcarbamoyladenosine biosynthesis protein TsaB
VAARPTASAMLRVAPQMLAAGLAVDAAQALPRYIRDKVAETTAERDHKKALARDANLAAHAVLSS